jgi:peptide/nickel transport system ATP-binding protein
MRGTVSTNGLRSARREDRSVLEVRDLRTYIRRADTDVRAVDGVSFDLHKGETLGVVGESGCGKTMTGLSIMRLLPAGARIAGGSIRLGDTDLATASPETVRQVRGDRIGMIFQDPMTGLNPTMTIGRQVAETVRVHRGVPWRVARERAAEVLALVGMPRPRERLEDYPHQLSGGLRQRVMIAMALACEPDVIIADEPTTALDVTIQAQILGLLDELRSRLGTAMILITHDMGVIAGRTDRVLVMYAGQIVESATTEALFAGMRHPYTEALLASIPRLDHDRSQRLSSISGLPPDLSRRMPGCPFAPRCTYAQDICWTENPRLTEGDPGHHYACFRPCDSAAEDMVGKVSPATGTATPGVRRPAVTSQVSAAELLPVNVQVPDGQDSGGTPEALVPGSTLIEFRHVSKTFVLPGGRLRVRTGRELQAVTDVSLSIRRGETFGLVGESGCGKTTLGRMAVALEAVSAGEVLFEGHEVGRGIRRDRREVRQHLQMMFQDPYASLDPRMRAGSIIREPLAIQGTKSRGVQDQRVAELAQEVGLPRNALSRYPHEFSGGQRQRIGLARALALKPKLIVADEPVSALDVSVRSQILNLMKELQVGHEMTYVFISHDLSVVRYIADRIGVMYLGQVVEIGTSEDIYARSAHPYTRALLDAIPVPNPALEREKRGTNIVGDIPSPVDPPSGCRFRTRCDRAQEQCAAEAPLLAPFGQDHYAACHFPLWLPTRAKE